jgi:hypothetical protein
MAHAPISDGHHTPKEEPLSSLREKIFASLGFVGILHPAWTNSVENPRNVDGTKADDETRILTGSTNP